LIKAFPRKTKFHTLRKMGNISAKIQQTFYILNQCLGSTLGMHQQCTHQAPGTRLQAVSVSDALESDVKNLSARDRQVPGVQPGEGTVKVGKIFLLQSTSLLAQ
jgi:hypothetical protein